MAKKADTQQVPSTPSVRYGEAEGGGCGHAACTNSEAYRCLYRDRRAVDCNWVACPEHLRVVDGRAYCMRHAGVVEVLLMAKRQGTELLPPDLDNRCASLVRAVAMDLNEQVLERLVRWGDTTTSIINDHTVRYTRIDNAHHDPGHWERVWGLATKTGILLRVGVRVEDSHQETVVLTAGVTRLAETVPPWVQRHIDGDSGRGPQSELVERLAFQQHLLQALDAHVDRFGIMFPRTILSAHS
jgi:hypothetical protein